jgi:hypothetical protein
MPGQVWPLSIGYLVMNRIPNEQCKTCKSSHLSDYDRWRYVEKLSPRKLSARALQEFGENISRTAFSNHYKYHSQVPAAVQEQYEAQKAATLETAGRVIDEIGILDQLIQDELESHGLVKAWITQIFKLPDPPKDEYGDLKLPYIPMALITMSQGTVAEIRQLIKIKSDLLSGDLKGTEAQMIQQALERANEHKKRRLSSPVPKTGPESESKP